MAHFTKNIRHTVVSLHIIFSALWAGAALSIIILLFRNNPQNASELLAYNWAIKLIDDWIIIGSATGSFLTGLLLSWKTPWGFFKHRWVIVKLVLMVFMIVLGSAFLGTWINGSVYMVQEQGLNVFENKKYLDYQTLAKFWGSFQLSVLFLLFFVSVFKPWKKLKR